LLHEARGRRAPREHALVEPRDRPDSDQCIRHEKLVRIVQVAQSQIRFAWSEADVRSRLEHDPTHDASDSIARDGWRQQLGAANREYIAAAAADHALGRIEQETLLHVSAAQLYVCEHLLEPAQVLQIGERR
jgi:hypothetical protein